MFNNSIWNRQIFIDTSFRQPIHPQNQRSHTTRIVIFQPQKLTYAGYTSRYIIMIGLNRVSRKSYLYEKLILVSLGITAFLSTIHAYMITIDTGIENECFHERVSVGVKLGFSFEVIDGGFFDIDVAIRDPKNVILHQETRASNGKYTIEANIEGSYQFCFSNRLVSHSPKSILFDIDRSDDIKTGASVADGSKPDDETTKLMGMVETLLLATISSRHDVRHLAARDRIHRRINENTNSRIVWWSAMEFILLLVVSLGQVWYLKRFFEIRRKA